MASSSSSFSSDLFGSSLPSPSPSPTGIFDAVFSPSSKGRKQDTKQGSPGHLSLSLSSRTIKRGREAWFSISSSVVCSFAGTTSQSSKGGENLDPANKGTSSIFQDETVRPCNFSSSIYYGGQDNYSSPSKHSGSPHIFKKDSDEDGCASRGNWWQGMVVIGDEKHENPLNVNEMRLY
ncbi:hypothetical protein GIB67_001792 [Kingdonia uniflora]|uniref:Uncharacterized protein n=1 Tax=Kingdonia uniflora TaxID=39325 RepID=A0A7J7LBJ9_9MAGN|nr:hypothetical protein GIB67_001792 [Kingdonia uniflora]